MNKKAQCPKRKENRKAWSLANSLAKGAAVYVFRNGPVEDIHAEGRLTQEEMKTLNQYMVNRLGEIFYLLATERGRDLYDMLLFSRNCAVDWDDINLSELEDNVQVGKRFVDSCKI